MSYRELSYEEKEELMKELEKLTGGDDRVFCYNSLKNDLDELCSEYGLFYVKSGGNPVHNDRVVLGFDVSRFNAIGMIRLGMRVSDYGADKVELNSGTSIKEHHIYFELWWD
jgi:hypothetical protein